MVTTSVWKCLLWCNFSLWWWTHQNTQVYYFFFQSIYNIIYILDTLSSGFIEGTTIKIMQLFNHTWCNIKLTCYWRCPWCVELPTHVMGERSSMLLCNHTQCIIKQHKLICWFLVTFTRGIFNTYMNTQYLRGLLELTTSIIIIL